MKTFKEFIAEQEDAIHPMINIDGIDKHRHNSEGVPIHHTDEGIKNFYKWFGNSSTVDKHGRPKVMYHGTNREFDEFGDNQEPIHGGITGAHFFSKTKSYSKEYGKRIIPVYLKTEKELPQDQTRKFREIAIKENRSVGSVAREHGYDHKHIKLDGRHSIMMYKPEHIKHAESNKGEFSSDSRNLYESIQEKGSMVGGDGTKYVTDGGYIDVKHKNTDYSPRKHSIVDFVVDEDRRGQGIGKKLLKHALSKHDDLGGQASSTASVKVMHDAGMRHPEMPNGSFEDHEAQRKRDSSIFMAHKDHLGKPYV